MSKHNRRSLLQSAAESRVSRRSLMTGALATAAVATLPRATYAARQTQSFQGKFRIEAHDYTPSESMDKSPDNPIPHKALQDAIDQYTQMYPDVEIETVR